MNIQLNCPSINIYGLFIYPEIKMIAGQKLSFDPMVIQLDIVINGIYTQGQLIAASDKSSCVHLLLVKY